MIIIQCEFLFFLKKNKKKQTILRETVQKTKSELKCHFLHTSLLHLIPAEMRMHSEDIYLFLLSL